MVELYLLGLFMIGSVQGVLLFYMGFKLGAKSSYRASIEQPIFEDVDILEQTVTN